MKKTIILMCIYTAGLFQSYSVHAEDRMRFGVILSLSGEVSNLGAACQHGLQMSYEKLDKGTQDKIELRYEDDANNPSKTVSAYTKLVAEGVSSILSFTSGPSKAVAHLAENAKIPLIAIASDPEIIRNKKYVMNLWVSPNQEAKMLHRLLEHRKLLRIARISAVQAAMLSVKDAFDRQPNSQIKILQDEEYAPDSKDFRTYLSKLGGRKDIDAIFVNLYVGQVGLFAKQAREMGILLPLVNIETFEDPAEVTASQGALLNQEYIQADDSVGDFAKEYSRRYPGITSFTAGNCYDALTLVAKAVNEKQDINSFLHQVKNFSGAMGTYSAETDNTFSLGAEIKRVTEHGFERVAIQP